MIFKLYQIPYCLGFFGGVLIITLKCFIYWIPFEIYINLYTSFALRLLKSFPWKPTIYTNCTFVNLLLLWALFGNIYALFFPFINIWEKNKEMNQGLHDSSNLTVLWFSPLSLPNSKYSFGHFWNSSKALLTFMWQRMLWKENKTKQNSG